MDGKKIPTASLQPMAVMRVQLGESAPVGIGPKGDRLIINIVSVELTSEKLNASLATVAAGEWATVSEGSIFALDVRLTLKTDDGEFIYVEYTGRGDGATDSSQHLQHFRPEARNTSGLTECKQCQQEMSI